MSRDAQITSTALPDDPAALKQLIVSLVHDRDEQVRQREQRIAQLETRRQELEQAHRQRIAELELEKLRLLHQLELLKKRYYGPRADRIDSSQLVLEFAADLEARPLDPALLAPRTTDEQSDLDAKTVRRVRHGRRDLSAFNHLPVTRKVHDLPEQDKPCPCCGTPRQQIGQESSWQVEYVPAHFERIEHVRLKYACRRCEPNGDNPQISLAGNPREATPINKGMAGPGLLAYVVTAKFADHLPLYRLEGIFARQGLEISRSTMSVWCGDVADLLQPLYRLMVQRVLLSHLIHTDDTVLPMLAPEKTRQARIWVYIGDEANPYNVFDFTLSRARDGPARFLKVFKGTLQADAYGGYEGICVAQTIVQAGCWAHARRKFVDTVKLDPAITGAALDMIGKLFVIEARAKELGLPPEERLALRHQQSRPLVEQLHEKLLGWKERLLPKHPVAQAIGYALNQWGPLTVFLSDGAVALDNNAAERQMKRIAIGRKNYLFVGNQRGGESAAVLASITSTCQRHGIDPQLYLTQLLANLPHVPLSQVADWLPDRWKQRREAVVPGDAASAGV